MTEASKASRAAKVGGAIVAIISCASLLSAEVRGWLGLTGEKSPFDAKASGNAATDAKAEGAGKIALSQDNTTGRVVAVSPGAAPLPGSAALRVAPEINDVRLKLFRENSNGTVDMRGEISLSLRNAGSRPLAVVWFRSHNNARLEIDGSGVLKRLVDTGGVRDCYASSGTDCWRSRQNDYTVIDPGSTIRATLEMQDDVPSLERPRLAAANTAIFIGALHIVDPTDGSSATQTISMPGIKLNNQVPKS